MILLICGIPGTGKSTFGRWLVQNEGFLHLDVEQKGVLQSAGLESQWNQIFASGSTAFFLQALGTRNVVIDWGFPPELVNVVQAMKNSGIEIWWFDGDRPAALRHFINRGNVSQEAFYLQMYKIEHLKIVDTLKPHIVNPFNNDGTFKSPDRIWAENK